MYSCFLEVLYSIQFCLLCSGIGGDSVDAPPTSCGVGVVSRVNHTPSPQEATCLLCQEESQETGLMDKLFVQAVFVQRSAVLRKGQPLLDKATGKSNITSFQHHVQQAIIINFIIFITMQGWNRTLQCSGPAISHTTHFVCELRMFN